jgi:hypothetical protein
MLVVWCNPALLWHNSPLWRSAWSSGSQTRTPDAGRLLDLGAVERLADVLHQVQRLRSCGGTEPCTEPTLAGGRKLHNDRVTRTNDIVYILS